MSFFPILTFLTDINLQRLLRCVVFQSLKMTQPNAKYSKVQQINKTCSVHAYRGLYWPVSGLHCLQNCLDPGQNVISENVASLFFTQTDLFTQKHTGIVTHLCDFPEKFFKVSITYHHTSMVSLHLQFCTLLTVTVPTGQGI